MFSNGAIVTLIASKSHGEGDDIMSLSANTCGMVVQVKKKSLDNNHEYVVDFGPYGQWYCYHNELAGQESNHGEDEDYEDDLIVPELFEERPRVASVPERNHEENTKEPIAPVIDFEADLKKRMKEIENGSY